MLNIKAASLSLVALSITAAFALPAHAESGKIELQGRVGENCTVAVAQLPKATALDIIAGEKEAQVADVVESCNIGAGYKVSLTSANAGRLLNPLTGAQPVGFSVAYDNADGAIEKELVALRDTAQFGKRVPVLVSFPANPQAIAGTYSDTVTITIAAK